MSQPSVTVIGTGALGTVLARGLYENDYPVTSLYNRRLRKAETLSREVNAHFFSEFPESAEELGSIIFITVRDAEIAKVAQNLSKIADDFSGYTIIHCSGSESTDLLKPLKAKSAQTAAFHPLQTFTVNSGTQAFRNIYFDIETAGNSQTFKLLRQLATSLGGQTVEVSAKAKPYLHAAAVMASNYLVTLMEASAEIANLGGLDEDEALAALLPLVRTTLQNVESQNISAALTGPIKRGDTETVQRHLQILSKDKNLLSLYKNLGLETLKLADRSNSLSNQKKAELYELLK